MTDEKKKLLYIEDDLNQRQLFSMYLSGEGYDVDQVDNGMDGMDKLKNNSYDLVITDLRMPGLDGIELIRKISARQIQTPLIIHTAYSHYKSNFLTWMANAYVNKSSDPEGLLDAVHDILYKS